MKVYVDDPTGKRIPLNFARQNQTRRAAIERQFDQAVVSSFGHDLLQRLFINLQRERLVEMRAINHCRDNTGAAHCAYLFTNNLARLRRQQNFISHA